MTRMEKPASVVLDISNTLFDIETIELSEADNEVEERVFNEVVLMGQFSSSELLKYSFNANDALPAPTS